jgi:threonine dehydrogenase-like Zn-dependent dehydrogenase
MRATVMYGAGDVRVEDRPDPKIRQPTDAVVRVLRAAICGSDLHPYHSMPPTDQGRPMGHEFLGVVEDVGSQVSGLKAGDLVITPFTWADNTCNFCRKGCTPRAGTAGASASTASTAAKAKPSASPRLRAPLSSYPSPRTPRCWPRC